jgi:hypothetical protein
MELGVALGIFLFAAFALFFVFVVLKAIFSSGTRSASVAPRLRPRVPLYTSDVLILDQPSSRIPAYDPSSASQPSDSPEDQSCCQPQDSSAPDSGNSCSSNDTSSDSSSSCDCSSSDSGSSACSSSDSNN